MRQPPFEMVMAPASWGQVGRKSPVKWLEFWPMLVGVGLVAHDLVTLCYPPFGQLMVWGPWVPLVGGLGLIVGSLKAVRSVTAWEFDRARVVGWAAAGFGDELMRVVSIEKPVDRPGYWPSGLKLFGLAIFLIWGQTLLVGIASVFAPLYGLPDGLPWLVFECMGLAWAAGVGLMVGLAMTHSQVLATEGDFAWERRRKLGS